MPGPENNGVETSKGGERIAPGFTKYHFEPKSLPPLHESTLVERDEGEGTVDRGALDVEVWDTFIRKKIGAQEGLDVCETTWVLDYLAGDVHPKHRDYPVPFKKKTVVVSVEGEGLFSMLESPSLSPLHLSPGDTVIVDGRVNPLHFAEALTDRRVVVATYTYS